MKNERIRVVDLARELHVSARELVSTAKALDMNVLRGAALLHSGQVHRLRVYYENTRRAKPARSAPVVQPVRVRTNSRPDDLRSAMCTCCRHRFAYRPLSESRELCGDCREHFERPGEPGWQTQIRLEDHETKSRALVDEYREACEKLRRERDEAYAKRNKWMAALVEIVVAHAPDEEGDGCVCGASEHPCLTRRHLRDVNRGIYARCEELEGMNEVEFNKVLYGVDYAFFEEWDDGVA